MKKIQLFVVMGIFVLAVTACGQAGVDESPTPFNELDDTLALTDTQPTAMAASTEPSSKDDYEEQRQEMVENTIMARGVENPDVLRAMIAVPRHEFVPKEFVSLAYEDHPLPIGYGQTISQPYIVAWMTELLELEPGDKVLEIGTGSGYQAAVLAELGYVEVYSIEIIPELAVQAAFVLEEIGYPNLHLKQGDGYFGWEESAPFDAIIVTAAPDHLPLPLVQQLTEDGRIVIPIGPPGGYQTLWRFIVEDGELVAYNLAGVAFVPFTRQEENLTPTP